MRIENKPITTRTAPDTGLSLLSITCSSWRAIRSIQRDKHSLRRTPQWRININRIADLWRLLSQRTSNSDRTPDEIGLPLLDSGHMVQRSVLHRMRHLC